MSKIMLVQPYQQQPILDRWFERAAKVAGLEWSEVAKVTIADRPLEEMYETVEEPIYTKTGKLSKKTKKIKRKSAQRLECEGVVIQIIRREQPNILVAAGDEVFESLTGIKGVWNYRGSVVELRQQQDGFTAKVIATEPPKHGDTLGFWILARDLQKAKREGEFKEIIRTPFHSYHNPDHNLQESLTLIEMVGNLKDQPWTLDVETRAGTLACFGICYKDGKDYVGFCVPVQTTTGPYWSLQEEYQIWEAMRMAAGKNPNLVNQNVEYDLYYILRYGVEPMGVYMDTMLAHSCLYPELPKSLDFLASWYLDDVVYWKSDHRDWTGRTPDEALWEYNVKDAVYTLRIAEKIDEELKRRGMFNFYHGD